MRQIEQSFNCLKRNKYVLCVCVCECIEVHAQNICVCLCVCVFIYLILDVMQCCWPRKTLERMIDSMWFGLAASDSVDARASTTQRPFNIWATTNSVWLALKTARFKHIAGSAVSRMDMDGD